MATFDDYDGVYFSTLALRLYHPEVLEDTEILVIDNHPDGPCATALKDLDKWVPGYRYVPNDTLRGTAARDLVFREANADWVLCMDSHVLIEPGALRRLLDWLDGQSESRDLLQGPLLLDDLHTMHTHFEPVWRDGMYGIWGSDPRAARADQAPFEIAMQGLGLFACRRQAWPGFNPRFRGFGGEEGYIHEKFRQRGGRTLCLPFLRWTHRFARPLGVRYPNLWEERIRNYLIGFSELGLDTAPLRDHFREHVGGDFTDEVIERVTREMANPFFYFDAIYCINLDAETGRWERMMARFERLGIAGRVKRIPALATPDNQYVGCTLSHRRVVAEARYSGFNNVLVFEDDAVFLDDTLAQLRRSVDELKAQHWNLFYLGGHKWGRDFAKVPGCSSLETANGLTCAHALAYNHTVFDRILADLPADEAGMRQWITDERVIDQYLRRIDRALICAPVLATQAMLLPQEAPELADRFVI